MSVKIPVTLIILLSIVSCVNTSDSFDSYEQKVLLNRDYLLESRSCSLSVLDTIENNYLYSVEFDKVMGGGTYLFGKRIKEGNGYKSKRLNVIEGENKIQSFSIDDFKAINQDTIDLNQSLDN